MPRQMNQRTVGRGYPELEQVKLWFFWFMATVGKPVGVQKHFRKTSGQVMQTLGMLHDLLCDDKEKNAHCKLGGSHPVSR